MSPLPGGSLALGRNRGNFMILPRKACPLPGDALPHSVPVFSATKRKLRRSRVPRVQVCRPRCEAIAAGAYSSHELTVGGRTPLNGKGSCKESMQFAADQVESSWTVSQDSLSSRLYAVAPQRRASCVAAGLGSMLYAVAVASVLQADWATTQHNLSGIDLRLNV